MIYNIGGGGEVFPPIAKHNSWASVRQRREGAVGEGQQSGRWGRRGAWRRPAGGWLPSGVLYAFFGSGFCLTPTTGL